jgi:hypothetical protein
MRSLRLGLVQIAAVGERMAQRLTVGWGIRKPSDTDDQDRKMKARKRKWPGIVGNYIPLGIPRNEDHSPGAGSPPQPERDVPRPNLPGR